tara:strand:+ start:2308 stop:2418 length:111 start_codon:yes stop_codon:yes gene_type:complete
MKNRIGMGNSILDFKSIDRELDDELDEFLDDIDEDE